MDGNGNVIDQNEADDCYGEANVGVRVEAARTIEPNEMITIQYVDVSAPVKERRLELKELFYFDCSCSKCLSELLEDSAILDVQNEFSHSDLSEDSKARQIQEQDHESICCEN
jgi:hypothetical protein